MSSRSKLPWWASVLISIGSFILLIALIVGGGCIFLKAKYDISVFDTISQIKTINQEVNESEKFNSKFTSSDMESAKNVINSQISNLITYSTEEGYKINDSIMDTMSDDILLTEKQVGAIIDMLIKNNNVNSFNVSGQDIPFSLVQIAFSNVSTNGVDYNVVVKLDITSIKANMKNFPLNLISNYIPNYLYVSSIVTITKGETAFAYATSSKSISTNNMSEVQTASFLKTINTFIQFQSAEELNLTVGNSFVNTLIGNSENNGLAYSLRDCGATDYDFSVVDNVNYFVIKK